MNRSSRLLGILEDFVSGKISAVRFSKEYGYFYDMDSIEKEVDCGVFRHFNDIYFEVDFFEPDDELRKEDESYLDEEQLRQKTQVVYNEIKKKFTSPLKMPEQQTINNKNEPRLFHTDLLFDKKDLEELLEEGFDVFSRIPLNIFISEQEGIYSFYSYPLNVYDVIKCFKEDFKDLNVFFVDYLENRFPLSQFNKATRDMKTSKPFSEMTRELDWLKDYVECEFGMYMGPSALTFKDTQKIREIEKSGEKPMTQKIREAMSKMNIRYAISTRDICITGFYTYDRNQVLQSIDYSVRGHLYNTSKKVFPEIPLEVREQIFSEAKKTGIFSLPILFNKETSKHCWSDFQKKDNELELIMRLGEGWNDENWDSVKKAHLSYDGTNWSFSFLRDLKEDKNMIRLLYHGRLM